jgi:predicted nuclease of restriction endonuclease-like (RecB) superfamily
MHEIVMDTLVSSIKDIILKAKLSAFRSNNAILLNTYWEIGRLIVEDEQNGNTKAIYGKAVLKNISSQLTLEFGKGFDESNLRNIRQFYLAFKKRDALRHELSWTHYRMICRVENEELRLKYIQHAIDGNWDTRTLQRNIQTQYIGRIIAPEFTERPIAQNLVKDPYILEFLGMPPNEQVTENKIETALINHLKQFLMELGKGFAFVARQQHIVTDTADFYIDLVFYNYYLKCLFLSI